MDRYDECRVYVDHVIAEHRRLHRMLRTARAFLAANQAADGAAIVGVLQQVRDELAAHFREEEGGGCLDEAVSRHPGLAAEERRIETEHPQLLEAIERLIELAAARDWTAAQHVVLEHEFDAFCQRLDVHEAAENRLLREGFGIVVNGEGCGEAACT